MAASRIAITNGASGALNLAFACLANPGERMAVGRPWVSVQPATSSAPGEGMPRSIPVGPRAISSRRRPGVSARHARRRTAGLLRRRWPTRPAPCFTLAEIEALAAVCREPQGHFWSTRFTTAFL